MGRHNQKQKRELTYWPARRGFKKVIDGKTYYFQLGKAKGPDDSETYLAALREYLELRDKLGREQAEQIERAPLPNGSTVELTCQYFDWSALSRPQNGSTATPDIPPTIQRLVNVYLEDRAKLVEAGQLSRTSYSSDKHRLATFISFCNFQGKSLYREVLSTEFLSDYRHTLLGALAQGNRPQTRLPSSLENRAST